MLGERFLSECCGFCDNSCGDEFTNVDISSGGSFFVKHLHWFCCEAFAMVFELFWFLWIVRISRGGMGMVSEYVIGFAEILTGIVDYGGFLT